eukprot:6435065-Amphidinium_carterae.1
MAANVLSKWLLSQQSSHVTDLQEFKAEEQQKARQRKMSNSRRCMSKLRDVVGCGGSAPTEVAILQSHSRSYVFRTSIMCAKLTERQQLPNDLRTSS